MAGKAEIELSAVDKTRAAFDAVQRNMEGLAGKASLAQAAVAGLASSAAAVSFVALIKKTLDAGDELNKLSQKTGIAVERLSELKWAAQLGGVDSNTLGKGLREFNKTLVEASDSSSKAAKVFTALGVDITAGPDRAFRQFAEAFSQLPEGELRAAAAAEVLKKAGFDLISVLAGGAKGLDAAAEEARKLGLVMSAETAAAAERFNDNMTRLTASSTALGIALTTNVLPPLIAITDNIVRATVAGEKWTGVLREMAKLAAATFAQTPGWIGSAMDKQAESLFGKKPTRDVSGKIGGLGVVDPPAGVNPDAVRRALAGGAEGRAKAAKDMTAEYERQARLVQEAEEQAAKDTTGAWSAVAEQRNKELEELAKSQAEMWKQVFESIDREQEEAIAQGAAYLDALKTEGEDTFKSLENAVRGWGNSFTDALADMALGGEVSFKKLADSIIRDLFRIQIQKNLTDPLVKAGTSALDDAFGKGGGGSGIAGFFSNIGGSISKFLGFADGGSFQVGGQGGTDSQLVAFRASPDETVSVTRPGQGGGSTNITLAPVIHIDARSDAGQIHAIVSGAMAQVQNDLYRQMGRGGAWSRRVGLA